MIVCKSALFADPILPIGELNLFFVPRLGERTQETLSDRFEHEVTLQNAVNPGRSSWGQAAFNQYNPADVTGPHHANPSEEHP